MTRPLASSMMAPALLQIGDEFSGTSEMLITFSVSIYVSILRILLLSTSANQNIDYWLRYRSSPPRPSFRNIRTQPHLQRWKCSLHPLHGSVWSFSQCNCAFDLPSACWCLWWCSVDQWWWYHFGPCSC